jgi:hypothetical protein
MGEAYDAMELKTVRFSERAHFEKRATESLAPPYAL